jgi:probable F420-dependent oxidoreductase
VKADFMYAGDPSGIAAAAKAAEAASLDGLIVPETNHDAFLNLAVAATSTSQIRLGSAIAIAFARTPMTVAISAHDLQRLSEGRLMLGLGTQIRPHITNRYSMPWSQPAARMREFVCAVRAIWASWQDGTQLNFRGEFYTHTLMTPMFAPEPLAYDVPPILLAAVGEQMTRVAADVADGLICHPLTTPRYLAERTLPLLPARDNFLLVGEVLVATGSTEAEMAAAVRAVRRQVAFYASTPAYRPMLEHHGWAEAQPELNALSKRGAWDEMANLVTEEMLETFAVVAEPEHVGKAVRRRFDGLLDRVTLIFPPPIEQATAITALCTVQETES